MDNVLLPTGNVVLNDSGAGYNFTTGVPNFKEFGYAATGLAGESRQPFDGNGPSLRFFSAGGAVPPGGPVPNLRLVDRRSAPAGAPSGEARPSRRSARGPSPAPSLPSGPTSPARATPSPT